MNILGRRTAIRLAVAAAIAAPWAVTAQRWQSKAITIVAAYPAGGVADQMARTLAAELAKRVGQPVIVENRVGAAGMIGTNTSPRRPPTATRR